MAGTKSMEIKNENDLIILDKIGSEDIVANISFLPASFLLHLT